MTKTYNQLQQTHQLYCNLTGLCLEFDMRRLHPWECFCSKFSDDDLRTVIRFINEQRSNGRQTRSLTFRNFISGPESLLFFEEDLAEARARNRATRTDTDRASVLRATGRTETPQTPVRTAEDVMRCNEALKQFLQLKESL